MKVSKALAPSHQQAASLHAQRIYGLDLARAVAVIGMIFAHLAPSSPLEGATDGYPSSLFAVLAGCSMAIMLAKGNAAGGAELAQARHRLLLRGVIIGVIGLALSSVQAYVAVVLGTIAWIFLLLGPVTRWRTRNVVLLAIGLTAASTALQALTMVFYTWYPMELMGPYPIFAWLAYGTLGILIHRFLLQASVAAQVWAAILGMAGYALSVYARSGAWFIHFGSVPEDSMLLESGSKDSSLAVDSLALDSLSGGVAPDLYFDPGRPGEGADFVSYLVSFVFTQSLSHSGGFIDIAVSAVAAVGVIATCLLVARSAVLVKGLFPFRAIAQMALTAYVIHVVTAGIYLAGLYSPESFTPEPEPTSISSSSESLNSDSTEPDTWDDGKIDSCPSSGAPGYTCSCWLEEDYFDESGSWSEDPMAAMNPHGWWPAGLTLAGLLVLCPLWLYWYPRGPFEQLVRSLSNRGARTDTPAMIAPSADAPPQNP